MHDTGSTLVVAGVSVRTLAESAAQGGYRVIALDLFGDADTRRASARWAGIGVPGSLAIDAARLRTALAEAADEPGVIGWVAGSGFEGATELLDIAPTALPRLGMATADLRALRDPRHFFATLGALGLAHPPVAFEPPASAAGWLVKRAGGTGGWHIRDAARPGSLHADTYWQAQAEGMPMSVLFLADGRRGLRLALNRLTVRALGVHPHVYRGAIGPIDDAALAERIDALLAQLVPAFALRGLASLDFIRSADGTPLLLEINPRPSASMALHAHALQGGLMRAHVDAVCGRLPDDIAPASGLRGTEILFARRACSVPSALADALADAPDCHDLPDAGTTFAAGDPVCSVSAVGADPATVDAALRERRRDIADRLEPLVATQKALP